MIYKDQMLCANIFTFVLKTGLGSEQFCLKFQILIPEIWGEKINHSMIIYKMEKGEASKLH